MSAYIQSVREPYEQQLNEQLAVTEDTLIAEVILTVRLTR